MSILWKSLHSSDKQCNSVSSYILNLVCDNYLVALKLPKINTNISIILSIFLISLFLNKQKEKFNCV